MNKRGMSSLLLDTVMYMIIIVFFIILIFAYLNSKSNSGEMWEDFYAKEISRILNSAKPGDSVILDVHKGTGIANKNGLNIQEASNMFFFNAKDNLVCVTLTQTGGKCYPYFNEVVVTEVNIELGNPVNLLKFKIVSKIGDQNA